jgi:uncharacterized protein YukE
LQPFLSGTAAITDLDIRESTMKPAEKNNSFLKYIITVMMMAGLMLWSAVLFAAQSDENQAPGRTMAQQATKGKQIWNTTDHTKHKALQKDFKSGLEVTQACLSCKQTVRQSRKFSQ